MAFDDPTRIDIPKSSVRVQFNVHSLFMNIRRITFPLLSRLPSSCPRLKSISVLMDDTQEVGYALQFGLP